MFGIHCQREIQLDCRSLTDLDPKDPGSLTKLDGEPGRSSLAGKLSAKPLTACIIHNLNFMHRCSW